MSHKTSILLVTDVKYYTNSCGGHGTMIINIGQPFRIVVSNSAPIAHSSKHSEVPQWHIGHNRIDIDKFCPMTTKFRFTMAIISWICHNESKLCWYWTEFASIIPIVPNYGIACFKRACRIKLSRPNWTQYIGKFSHCFRALNHDRRTNVCNISYH